jgi:PAS domain S-box-containing protein
MENKLKLLFVEDMVESFEMAEYELRKSGLDFIAERVENSNDFESLLKTMNPDVVISDYYLPQFNGMIALKIAKSFDESMPFIILTGDLNEEIAVECMKSGANDYVLKEHLSKLPFSIREVIKQRDALRDKKKAEVALMESERRYRSIFERNFAAMMIVNPENGSIIDANNAAGDFYGYSLKDLLSKRLQDITDEAIPLPVEILNLAASGGKKHFYSKHITKSGLIKDVEIFCSPVTFWGKTYIHMIVHDITQRNRAIAALRNSLKANRELVREIFHRTKNNLQVIISIFGLQAMYFEDERLLTVFKEMEDRIKAMSLVHEMLYKSQSLSKLPLDEYITDLIFNIKSGYGVGDEKLSVIFDMERVEVLIDIALPCGLVINELVVNVIKHGYSSKAEGILWVTLKKDKDSEIKITVEDNGAGKGMIIDLNSVETLGLSIVKNIVEYQLKGTISLDTANGFKWVITFPDNLYEERV